MNEFHIENDVHGRTMDLLEKYDYRIAGEFYAEIAKTPNIFGRIIDGARSIDYILPINLPDNILIATDTSKNHEVSLMEAMERYEGSIIKRAYDKYKTTVGVSKALGISQPTAVRKIKKYVGKVKDE